MSKKKSRNKKLLAGAVVAMFLLVASMGLMNFFMIVQPRDLIYQSDDVILQWKEDKYIFRAVNDDGILIISHYVAEFDDYFDQYWKVKDNLNFTLGNNNFMLLNYDKYWIEVRKYV